MMKRIGMIMTVAALLLAAVSAPSLAAQPAAAARPVATVSSDVSQVVEIAMPELSSERTDFSSCRDIMAMGEKRLKHYNNVLAKAGRIVAKLQSMGVDTSVMQATIDEARMSVVDPLAAALASGDEARVASELRSKCLYNGAPYSFHFGAKMGVAGMSAVSAMIEDRAIEAGYGQQIEEIKGHLAGAQAVLDAAGTDLYTEEQKKALKEELRGAACTLRDVIKKLQCSADTAPVSTAARKTNAAMSQNAVMNQNAVRKNAPATAAPVCG